jgi:hypothetical protein
MRWLHQLRVFEASEPTELSRGLDTLLPTLSSRCLLLVLSDLHEAGAPAKLRLAAGKHDCVVLRLEDPAERGAPGAGLVRASEAESGYRFIAGGRARFVNHDAIEAELRRGGVHQVALRLDEHFIPYLRAYLRKRDCLGRAAR